MTISRSLKSAAKRVPFVGRLAWQRHVWRSSPYISPLSRLRLACAVDELKGPLALRLINSQVVSVRPNTSDLQVFWQIFVEGQYDLPYERDPEVIVDVGANVGFSTLFFALRFPRATVIAIEPDPDNFAALERNLAGTPNVSAIRAALWWRREPLTLDDPGIGTWGFRVSPARTSRLPVVTPDDLLGESERIDLLKLDVEGAEFELFAHPAWLHRVDAVAVELHERIRPGVEALFASAAKEFGPAVVVGEVTLVSRVTAT